MKKKNNSLVISICLAVIAIFLIVLSFFVDSPKKSNNSDNDKPNNSTSDNNVMYECKLKLEQGSGDYDIYKILSLTTSDGLVLESQSVTYIEFKNEDEYLIYKNDPEYSKDKTFDDQNKTITFSNNDKIDLTKDADGEKLELKYENYQKDLGNVGYVCEKK